MAGDAASHKSQVTSHKLQVGLVTLLALIVPVLTFDLVMVWILQCSVYRNGRRYQEQNRLLRKGHGDSIEMDDVDAAA